MKFKYSILFLLVVSCSYFNSYSQSLKENFLSPPDSIRLSTFYYWINNNISKEGVIKDLHAMKDAGITRVFIGTDIRNRTNWSRDTVGQYFGKVKVFSNEWWEVLDTALKTASDLNIEVGLFNCPGWSQSGGPWIKPKQAMKYLDASEIRIKGPGKFIIPLAKTDTFFEDVKVLAMRVPENYEQNLLDQSGTILKPHNMVIDSANSTINSYHFSTNKSVLEIELPKEKTVRSIIIYPGDQVETTVDFEIKTDNNYQSIQHAEFSRSTNDENLAHNFEPHAPFQISFAAVKGRNFRLVFRPLGNKPCDIRKIVLSSTPVITNLLEKKLAKIENSSPSWIASQNKTITNQSSALSIPDTSDVLDISGNMSADGTLKWNAPKGEWVIMRTGMRFIDVHNGPASFEAEGLEVDKMNKEDVRFHFNSFIGQILKRIPADDRKSLKMVVMDSYERGGTNFTDHFLEDFKKQYGYNPTSYLPTYFGHIIGSPEKTDRFLWDIRRFVADKVADNYVGGLREESHEHGMKTWLENYGNSPAEFLQYGGRSDEVSGEFWVGSMGNEHYEFLCRAAASAAHIYGKNKVSAESFTSGSWTKSYEYSIYPQKIKSLADWAFTQGINSTVLHLYVHQPYENVYPGVDAWFGTEFNRKNTWFKHMDLFTLYLRRCNFMLQQGRNVADIAYYIGEDTPTTEKPKWVKFQKGYNYDYINAEVIIRDMKVKDSRFILPDGTTYKVLVLPPEETMRPEVLRKIEQLVADGGVILGNPPSHSPSLQNYPHTDQIVKQMAFQLWGNGSEQQRKYGKGFVFNNCSLSKVLQTLHIVPDVNIENDLIKYTHRTLNGKEIYFIANLTGMPVQFDAHFRIKGLQPELWDALSGTTRSLPDFKQEKNTVSVPLQLSANGSTFIVFKHKRKTSKIQASTNFPVPFIESEIKGPWIVYFEHDSIKRGPEKPVIMKELKDWSQFDEKNIRYYSGTAVYSTSFIVNEFSPNKNYYLDLGDLSATAKIKINGKYAGGVWTYPYRINVNDFIKKGKNTLEVEVINTWKNRLIGDHMMPEKERIVYSRINPWNNDSTLQKSGLFGSVVLLSFEK